MTDMSPLRAPANLPSLVKTAFANAKATGDLSYFPTQVALLKLNSVHVRSRLSNLLSCPTLFVFFSPCLVNLLCATAPVPLVF